jgi:hypothetical protein
MTVIADEEWMTITERDRCGRVVTGVEDARAALEPLCDRLGEGGEWRKRATLHRSQAA